MPDSCALRLHTSAHTSWTCKQRLKVTQARPSAELRQSDSHQSAASAVPDSCTLQLHTSAHTFLPLQAAPQGYACSIMRRSSRHSFSEHGPAAASSVPDSCELQAQGSAHTCQSCMASTGWPHAAA